MTFEFLKWRSSFKQYKRGVRKNDIAFKRPRPWLDLTGWVDWVKFFFIGGGGIMVAGIVGIIAYFVVSGVAGGFVFNIMTWIYLFAGLWILFWVLHLVHSIRFHKIAKKTDVEFVPLSKAESLGDRVLTMPDSLTKTDYNILYSRYVWVDFEHQPYRDVTDWVRRISAVQSGGGAPTPTAQGGTMPEAMGDAFGKAIGYGISEKYEESRLKEIIDTAGGIPSPQEIVKILQTEMVPKYRKLLGDRLMRLYLVFLITQPPVLPYDESTSRDEMRAVADARDTEEVLDYLNKFASS